MKTVRQGSLDGKIEGKYSTGNLLREEHEANTTPVLAVVKSVISDIKKEQRTSQKSNPSPLKLALAGEQSIKVQAKTTEPFTKFATLSAWKGN